MRAFIEKLDLPDADASVSRHDTGSYTGLASRLVDEVIG
jgi:hypothetical protein